MSFGLTALFFAGSLAYPEAIGPGSIVAEFELRPSSHRRTSGTASFAAKQDFLNYTPLNRAGGTMTGKLNTAPSSLTQSGINVSPGVVPGVPGNGDVWVTSAGLFVRVNGVTIGPLIQAGAADPAYTVATLPTCNTAAKGLNAYVTDATSPTYNGTLTGGGAVVVPVFCSGVSWTAH